MERRQVNALILCWAICTTFLGGCRAKPTTEALCSVDVSGVRVDLLPTGDLDADAPLDESSFRESLVEAICGSELLSGDASFGGRQDSTRLEYRGTIVAEVGPAETFERVMFHVSLNGSPLLDAEGAVPEGQRSREAIGSKLAELFLSSNWQGNRVRSALVSRFPGESSAALQCIERQRMVEVAPTLARRFCETEFPERMRFFGGLVSLEATDELAVVTDCVSMEDHDTLVGMIPGVFRLGGPNGMGFIQSLAAAHDSPRVSTMAQTWLEFGER